MIQLNALQLDLLDILWRDAPLSAGELRTRIARADAPALTTVSTVLTRMVRKGVLAAEGQGRARRYRPLVSRREVRHEAASAVLDGVFAKDMGAMVAALLDARDVEAGELDRLQSLIDDARAKGAATPKGDA